MEDETQSLLTETLDVIYIKFLRTGVGQFWTPMVGQFWMPIDIIEGIGSAQNLHLTRLWSSKKLILIEGKDINYLKHFQDLMFPNATQPIDGLPNMPIGGWSGWPYAIGSAMLLKNAVGDDIITYCILDSDYYPPELKNNT